MEAGLPPSPLPSHVHLNFSVNVVGVKPGTVLSVFERAIAAFSRPSDPEMETGDQQVGRGQQGGKGEGDEEGGMQ
jgi:hypothetical protein